MSTRPPLNAVKSSPQLGKHTQPAARIAVTPRVPSPSPSPQRVDPVKITPPLQRSDTQRDVNTPKSTSIPLPPAKKKPTTRGSADEPGDDYIKIPPELYARVPESSHIVYHKTGDEVGKFYGGFVKSHHKTPTGWMTLIGYTTGDKATETPVMHENIDGMWKKYYQPAFIELWMTRNALVRSRATIEDLKREVADLAARLARMEGKTY